VRFFLEFSFAFFAFSPRQVGAEPANIIYVGDRINKDVKGALRAGMKPVLKNAYTNDGKKAPDGVERIERISELPELVGKINGVLESPPNWGFT